MASKDAQVIATLDLLIERPDLVGLEKWLTGADAKAAGQALAYLKRRGPDLAEPRRAEPYETGSDRRWIPIVVAAAALAPAETVKRLPWNDFWHVREPQAELLARTLLRRPREWMERFVPGAAGVRLGSRRETATAPFLFWLLDQLVREYRLEVPDGDAFLDGWARSRSDLVDPLYPQTLLPRLLRSPHLRHRTDLPDAVAEHRVAGLTRAETLDAVFEALASPRTPASQRVLGKLWTALAPTAHELAGRLPLLISALATGHGALTQPLLSDAVALADSAADLDEIVRTVTARPEKQQHGALLRLLERTELRERLGDAAMAGATAHYDTVDDTALRDRARRLHRTLGATAPVRTDSELAQDAGRFEGLWAPLPRAPRVPTRLEIPSQLDHALIWQLLGNQSSRDWVATHRGEVNRVGEAVLLECLVRAASRGHEKELRAWLPSHEGPTWGGLQPVASAILCWLRGDLETFHNDMRIPGNFFGGAEPRWREVDQLVNAAARETLSGAGVLRTVLSTPSHSDGTLALDVLVERVASGWVTTYTPYDFVLALFRLPPRLVEGPELSGLRLPVDAEVWAQHVAGMEIEPPDGIDLLRTWIARGGLSPHATTYRFEGHSSPASAWSWDPEHPPFPAEVLESLHLDHAALLRTASVANAAALAPGWPDLGVNGYDWRSTNPAGLLGAPGPLGTPSHATVLALMTGSADDRARAATSLLELVATDRLSEHHLREAADMLNRARLLPLSRFAQGIEQTFASGGLADLWKPALGVAEDAATRQPRPSGLPELLRVLTAYAPAVPRPTLPIGLADLATTPGTSKSHAEARALAAACERRPGHTT